jgi:hypothetical protein
MGKKTVMSTTELEQIHIERSREILSAATKVLPDEKLRPLLRTQISAPPTRRCARPGRRWSVVGGLDQFAKSPDEALCARFSALVLETMVAQAEIKDALIRQRSEVVAGVREALATLRNSTTTAAMAERAPVEAGRIGFRRTLFSRIETGIWVTRAAFAVDDARFAAELVAIGKANPRRLNGPLVESEMTADAQSNPRVHSPLVRYADTKSYVAALCWRGACRWQ